MKKENLLEILRNIEKKVLLRRSQALIKIYFEDTETRTRGLSISALECVNTSLFFFSKMLKTKNGTIWNCRIITQRDKGFKSFISADWEFQARPVFLNISAFVIFSYFDPWIYSNYLIIDETFWKSTTSSPKIQRLNEGYHVEKIFLDSSEKDPESFTEFFHQFFPDQKFEGILRILKNQARKA